MINYIKNLKKIPNTESLKDTYNRVVPFFEKHIDHIKSEKKKCYPFSMETQ